MLTGRQLAEHLSRLLLRTEKQAKQIAFRSGGFDIGELQIPPGSFKAYSLRRLTDDCDLIVAHVTAVKGGFGVSKSAIRRWRRVLEDAAYSKVLLTDRFPILWPQIIDALEASGTNLDVDLLVKRLATWERYRETPYHQIASQMGDAVANRRIEQVSWHGNGDSRSGGNAGVGFAVDCHPSEILSPWMIDTAQAALERLIGRLLAESAKARREGIRLAPHRAFSGDRAGDPGPSIWEHVILPVVERNAEVIRIDYEARWKTGKPVPNAWDPAALYDSRGNRLALGKAAA